MKMKEQHATRHRELEVEKLQGLPLNWILSPALKNKKNNKHTQQRGM